MKPAVLRTEPTEAAFTRMVIALAKLRGWACAHFRPGMTRKGEWRTAVQGDGKGWPDLVLVRHKVIVAELKIGRPRATPEQWEWLRRFALAGVDAYLWVPADWDAIVEALK